MEGFNNSCGSSMFNGFIDRIKVEIGKYYGGKYKNIKIE